MAHGLTAEDYLAEIIMDGGKVEIARFGDTDEMNVVVSFGDRRFGIVRRPAWLSECLASAVWWREEGKRRQAKADDEIRTIRAMA